MNKNEAIERLKRSLENKKYEDDIDIVQFGWFGEEYELGLYLTRLQLLMGIKYKPMKVGINDVLCKEIYMLRCNPIGDNHDEKYDYFLTFDDEKKPKLLGGGVDFKYPNTSNREGLLEFFNVYKEIDKYMNGNASYAVIFDFVML